MENTLTGKKPTQFFNNELVHFMNKVVSNNYKCQHCKFYHGNVNGGFCLKAYKCLTTDFSEWDEDD